MDKSENNKSKSRSPETNSKSRKNTTKKISSIKQCKIYERPCITDVYNKVIEISNIEHNLPKSSNKGNPGNYLEKLAGIPTSSECLDCTDGEVKVFPLKKNKFGIFSPKETIAVTMINNDSLIKEDFINSKVYKKLSNVLYVPYYRENDIIKYMRPTIINLETNTIIKEQIKEDYDNIRKYLIENSTLERSSKIGVFLQNRTKGAGGSKPKTRAFYLRPKFVIDYVNINS
jgi:DNA mismatch repair protein MutH